jgi:hypothetical protein
MLRSSPATGVSLQPPGTARGLNWYERPAGPNPGHTDAAICGPRSDLMFPASAGVAGL